jgi:hypothetical protein
MTAGLKASGMGNVAADTFPQLGFEGPCWEQSRSEADAGWILPYIVADFQCNLDTT